MGVCTRLLEPHYIVRISVLIPPSKLIFLQFLPINSHLNRTLDNPDSAKPSPAQNLARINFHISREERKPNMSSYRTSEDSLTTFLSTFNQVLLGYILLAVVLSISMEGVLTDSSVSDPLERDDYNFEIKTAMERTKNHAAFMTGIIALTFAAVAFVLVDWAIFKHKHVKLTVWDVYVFKK